MHCGFHGSIGYAGVYQMQHWLLHSIGLVVLGILDISLGIGLVMDLMDLLHKETSFSHPGK